MNMRKVNLSLYAETLEEKGYTVKMQDSDLLVRLDNLNVSTAIVVYNRLLEVVRPMHYVSIVTVKRFFGLYSEVWLKVKA